MNPFLTKLWYWRLAFWKLANGCVIMGAMTFISGTADRNWSDMTTDQQMLVILAGVIAMAKQVDAFLDTTMATLKSGTGNSNPVAFVRKE